MRAIRRPGSWTLTTLMVALSVSRADPDRGEQAHHSTRQNDAIGTEDQPNQTVEDIDGNVYKTIRIGSQVWMAENLRVTRYRNGDLIPNVTRAREWANISSGAMTAYENEEEHVHVFGFLYNWFAVNDPRGLAPEGWRVPTDDDWKELERFLGMSQQEADGTAWRGTDSGGKLKATGTTLWSSPNTGATNESGFTALPGGYRVYRGLFVEMGTTGSFWSSTEQDRSTAWSRSQYFDNSSVYRYNYPKLRGFSVRCLKDSQTESLGLRD